METRNIVTNCVGLLHATFVRDVQIYLDVIWSGRAENKVGYQVSPYLAGLKEHKKEAEEDGDHIGDLFSRDFRVLVGHAGEIGTFGRPEWRSAKTEQH